MRILSQDQNVMILKENHIYVFIVGILFLLVGLTVIIKPDFFSNNPPMWSGIAAILLGVFVISVAKTTLITLNKADNKLLIEQKALIKKSIKEYSIDQIKEVELSASYASSNQSSGYSYNINFVLNNNEIIPLNPGSTSIVRVMGKQIITGKNVGVEIAKFLNVPFQEKRPPSVNETLSVISSTIQNEQIKTQNKEII